MKQENLPNTLARLSKFNLCFVLLYARLLLMRHLAGLLRPRDILIPVTLIQISIFTITALVSENFIVAFTTGNVLITAIAIFPLALRSADKTH